MSTTNRGPAAGPENRAALLRSARRLFAEKGYGVALSAIAKDAGVGQGTLYRHFPTRADLARSVVEETMTRLAAMADNHAGNDAFIHLWREIVDTLTDSVGFLDAALGPRGELGSRVPAEELEALLAEPLRRAQSADLVDATLTVDDVMLVLSMLHGAAHRVGEPDSRREAARRALDLVGRGLQVG